MNLELQKGTKSSPSSVRSDYASVQAEKCDATPFVLRLLRKAAVRCMRASFPAARLPPAPAAQ